MIHHLKTGAAALDNIDLNNGRWAALTSREIASILPSCLNKILINYLDAAGVTLVDFFFFFGFWTPLIRNVVPSTNLTHITYIALHFNGTRPSNIQRNVT